MAQSAASRFYRRKSSSRYTFGQMPGEGFSVDVWDLSTLVRHDPEVRSLFARNEQFVTAQAQQTAACNREAPIPERFAG